MCISQSTLDSIETSQDDEARIDLTRLEDWVWQDWDHDSIIHKYFIFDVTVIKFYVSASYILIWKTQNDKKHNNLQIFDIWSDYHLNLCTFS